MSEAFMGNFEQLKLIGNGAAHFVFAISERQTPPRVLRVESYAKGRETKTVEFDKALNAVFFAALRAWPPTKIFASLASERRVRIGERLLSQFAAAFPAFAFPSADATIASNCLIDAFKANTFREFAFELKPRANGTLTFDRNAFEALAQFAEIDAPNAEFEPFAFAKSRVVCFENELFARIGAFTAETLKQNFAEIAASKFMKIFLIDSSDARKTDLRALGAAIEKPIAFFANLASAAFESETGDSLFKTVSTLLESLQSQFGNFYFRLSPFAAAPFEPENAAAAIERAFERARRGESLRIDALNSSNAFEAIVSALICAAFADCSLIYKFAIPIRGDAPPENGNWNRVEIDGEIVFFRRALVDVDPKPISKLAKYAQREVIALKRELAVRCKATAK